MLTDVRSGSSQGSKQSSLLVLQDRDAKMMYLQKIFDIVGLVTGQAVAANPAKVSPAWRRRHAWTWAECSNSFASMRQGAAAIG